MIAGDLTTASIRSAVGGTGSRRIAWSSRNSCPTSTRAERQNIPGIIGLRAALIYLEEQGISQMHDTKMALTKRFLDGLVTIKESARRHAWCRRSYEYVSITAVDRDNAEIAFELERDWNIMTRVGLHCAPLAHQSLRTFPQGTVRFSFGATNTEEEIDTALEALATLTS